MTPEAFLSSVKAAIDAYVTGTIVGQDLVRRIDTLMADELPDGLSDSLLEMLNGFQDDLALYVEDRKQRKEHPAYFGPDELMGKTMAMKERLHAVRLCKND